MLTDTPNNAAEAIVHWRRLIQTTQINISTMLVFTSLPILGTALLIVVAFAFISKFVSERRLYSRRKREKEALHIENFMMLVIETKKERHKREMFREAEHQLERQESLESRSSSMRSFNFLNKFKGPSMNYNLPDENKVPMVLVRDAIARSSAAALDISRNNETQPHNEMLKIDEEVVQIVNKLIYPSSTPSVSKRLGLTEDEKTQEKRPEINRQSSLRSSNPENTINPVFYLNHGYDEGPRSSHSLRDVGTNMYKTQIDIIYEGETSEEQSLSSRGGDGISKRSMSEGAFVQKNSYFKQP